MKLIKPYFEIIEQESGLAGINKMIEMAGRTCYKSEKHITEESANKFVDRMINSRHNAMLEHGTIYLKMQSGKNRCESDAIEKYTKNKYTKYTIDEHNVYYITTNMRVLVENDWMEDIEYLCEPTEKHEKRHTVKFICDRGVSHEFVRHRVMSFAQESTRYCNYSKDKFNNEIVYILPPWMDEAQLGVHDSNKIILEGFNYQEFAANDKELAELAFMVSIAQAEISYHRLISLGWKAQEARCVLPTSLKTEIVMTGFEDEWQHFFDLRAIGTTGAPHPQAKELAEPLLIEFIDRGWASDEYLFNDENYV